MNYQKLIIVGNATVDAKKQTSKDGKVNYTTFGVGVGDNKENSTYFPVTVFGKQGEVVAQYVSKGRQLLVEGRIQVSEKGYFNVVADRVIFGAQPSEPAKAKETAVKKTKKSK